LRLGASLHIATFSTGHGGMLLAGYVGNFFVHGVNRAGG
jgi:hypothetical protein